MRKVVLLLAALLVLTPIAGADIADEIRTLDGSGNNGSHPEWGRTNTQYLRVARTNYADGIAKPVSGPSTRYVSNRIFNDVHQNLFSENGVTQWGFVWGQFMDHTFGLRQEAGGETANIPFSKADPLETFTNTVGYIPFMRTPAAPTTGKGTTARQQINTVSSYIDGASVYGPDTTRLEWLREGPVDGKLSNNGAKLLLDNGFLPRGGDPRRVGATTPEMALMGRLEAPGGAAKAFVAGDKRANENIALSSTHTLFALEHNRIVSKLPSNLPEELRFQIPQGAVGSPFAVQMNEYLQQNFKDVGINVKIEALEAQVMQDNLSKGIAPDVHAFSVGFSVDEMVNLQRHYRSDLVPPNGNTNPGWIENPELDAMLKKALETANEEERKKIYFDIQQKAVDLAAWVWVVHQKGARAWSKKVQGFVNPNSYMFTFKTVSLG